MLAAEVARRYALQVEYGGADRHVHRITPAVSVLVVTYQHAPFIAECLDGILAQQTDFPFEVIIGEDGSDDGTREICIAYADAHPDRIRLFLRDRALTQLPLDPDGIVPIKRLNGRFTRQAALAPTCSPSARATTAGPTRPSCSASTTCSRMIHAPRQ